MAESYSARAMAVHRRRRARVPPAAAAFALVVAAMVVASADAGWVKLLDNAAYGGQWNAPYRPVRPGSFTKAKAVHRSGYISCSQGVPQNTNVWNACGGNRYELLVNDDMVVGPSTSCSKVSTDIICDIPGGFDVTQLDTLTPTWHEVTQEYTVSDNHGTHYVDVYGWLDEGADDLLLHWSATEGTGLTVADSSGASPSHDGTLSSAELWDAKLIRFEEPADTVTSTSLTPTGSITLSAWVWWGDAAWPVNSPTGALPAAFGFGTGPGAAGSQGSLYVTFPDGLPTIDFGGVVLTAQDAMSTRAWHHVVVSIKAGVSKSSGCVLYLDNQAVSLTLDNVGGVAEPDSAPTFSAGVFSIAPESPAGAPYSAVWKGTMDDVRAVGHAMRAGAVSALYDATVRSHIRDDALRFDGETNYATLPRTFEIGSPLTIEAWVMCRAPDSNGQAIVDFADGDLKSVVALKLHETADRLQYVTDDRWGETRTYRHLTELNRFPRYKWTHVAVYDNNNVAYMFRDGLFATGTSGYSGRAVTKVRTQMYIGRSSRPATAQWNGYIDDLRLWNVARTESQIRDNMHRLDTSQDISGLLAWYTFDPVPGVNTVHPQPNVFNRYESVATTVADQSGNGNTLTLRCGDGCVVPSARPLARRGAVCGDGFRHEFEMCDDGNVVSGDGCSSLCETEVGFVCVTDSGLFASVCFAGEVLFQDDCDLPHGPVRAYLTTGTESQEVWDSFSVKSGISWWRVDVWALRYGSGGLRFFSNGNNADTWEEGFSYATSPGVELSEGTLVRYHVRTHFYNYRPHQVAAIARIAASPNPPALHECGEFGSCSETPTYTVCYNPGVVPAGYCDETVWLGYYVWTEQAFRPLEKLRAKYGPDVSLPSEVVLQIGGFSNKHHTHAFFDTVQILKLGDDVQLRCPAIEAASRPALRSCLEHKQILGESAADGPYTIDRGAGPFEVYCDMTTAGGGWDVVTVMRSETHLKFEDERCSSLDATCYGNINAVSGVPDTQLGGREDAEVLIKDLDSNLYTQLTGFSTSATGDGMVATYMTQRHTISTSDACSIGSASQSGVRHYCGSRTAETSLRITGHEGYSPHDLGSGLYTWVRLGGWWIGDTNGGGSQQDDHQTDLSYGSGGRVSFGLLDEATAVNYAVYYRAGSYARPGFDGSSIARDGTTISDVTATQGLSVAAFAETAESTVSKATFPLGDATEEQNLIDWLAAVPDGHLVAGVLKGDFVAPTAGNAAALVTAFEAIGVEYFSSDGTDAGWAFVGQKAFPTTYGPANNFGRLDAADVVANRLFSCMENTIAIPENAVTKAAAVLPPPESGTGRRSWSHLLGGADGGIDSAFDFDLSTALLLLNTGYLNREAQATYQLVVSSSQVIFETGYFEMQSQQGVGSFKQIDHNLDLPLTRIRVDVSVQAIDGDNAGYAFAASGAAMQSDSRANSFYGGVVFAYDRNTVRIWAPSLNNGQSSGNIINIGHGWGNEAYTQNSDTASVRVRIIEEAPADFDSGYFTMQSQQGANSFKKVAHGLGEVPGRVKVMTVPTDGNNAGFVFEGVGAAQSDDDHGEYGGVIFGYDDTHVWMWAPDQSNNRDTGYIVNVADGWAGNHMHQSSHTAQVRVLAWKDERDPPNAQTDWFDMVSDNHLSFREQQLVFRDEHNREKYGADRVQVQVMAEAGNLNGVVFESMGMAQETGYETWTQYGGVVSGFRSGVRERTKVRMWAGSRDPRNNNFPSRARLVFIGDGWGGEQMTSGQVSGKVRVRGWCYNAAASRPADAAVVNVEVLDVEEPPLVSSISTSVLETALTGEIIADGVFTVVDEDGSDNLQYSIVSGDPQGIFGVNTDGKLMLAQGGVLNPDAVSKYVLLVQATDGVHVDTGIVTVEVIDVNSPPTLTGATYEVMEESPVNTKVGTEPTVHDPDESDTLLFAIVSGNVDDAFKIAACGGQLRVSNDVIDYEGPTKTYVLNVTVTDDGDPSLMDWAVFTVNVLNKNDRPVCGDDAVTVVENSAPGTVLKAATLGAAVDPDGDALVWTLLYGDIDEEFSLDATTGVLTIYNNVTNYEEHDRYTLRVRVADTGHEETGGNLDCEFTTVVTVVDANDPPVVAQQQPLFVNENSAAGTVAGTIAYTDEDDGDTSVFALDGRTPTASSDLFEISAAGVVTVKSGAILNFESATTEYLLYVTCTDGGGPDGAGAAATVVTQQTVTVLDTNDLPAFTNAGPLTFSIPETAGAGTPVVTLTAADEDDDLSGDPLTFSITAQSPTDAFEVDATTGEVTVSGATAFDFEGGATTFTVTAAVTDSNAATTTTTITVTITDANDAPVVTSCGTVAPYWHMLPGKDAVISLVDAPMAVDDVVTWYFGNTFGSDGAACRDACAAQAGCAAYTLYTSSFYEEAWQQHCYGRVEGAGNIVTRGSASVVTSGTRQDLCDRLSVTENAAADTVVSTTPFTFSDEDGDSVTFSITDGNGDGVFAIDGSNNLVVAGTVDYEAANEHILTITATDNNAAGAASSSVVVFVAVVDVDEPPILSDTTLNVRKASVAGEAVGPALQAVDPEGLTVTYAITDGTKTAGDGDAINAGNVDTLFNIAADGQITVADETMFATYQENTVITLTVVASDPTGHDTTITVTVDVLEGNAAPIVAAGQSFSIDELSAPGTVAGALVATDPDSPTLTYRMVPAAAGSTASVASYFDMDPSTGVLTVKAGVTLDHEATPTLTATAEVEDDNSTFGNRITSRAFTVVILDTDEEPTCLDTLLSVPELSATGTVVAAGVGCEDPDIRSSNPDVLSFEIVSGNDDGAFSVATTAGESQAFTLTVADSEQLDYEGQLWHNLTLRATDSDGLSTTYRVDVRMVDVREAPLFAPSPAEVDTDEDTPVGSAVHTFGAIDPDGDRMFWTVDVPAFSMDGSVLRVAQTLDYEAVQWYNLTIQVADRLPNALGEFPAETLFDTIFVVVNVGNVNDLTIDTIAPLSFATAGGDTITFRGTNFGFINPVTPAVVTATYQAAQSTVEYSVASANCAVTPGANVEITCTTVEGVGSGLLWTLTVNGESVSSPIATGYTPPVITGVTSALPSASSGGQAVVLTGTNLGNSAGAVLATYGRELGYVAANCRVATPHTAIECDTVPGAGMQHEWQITVAGQTSPWSGTAHTTSYARPTVTGITAPSLTTEGGEVVVVGGTNFGPGHVAVASAELNTFHRVTAEYGDNAGDGVWYAAACTVATPHTQLQCVSAPGVGANLVWRVRVGGSTGGVSTATTSYLAPKIALIRDGEGAIGASTRGGERVILEGTNFGPATPTGARAAQFGAVYGVAGSPASSWFTAASCAVTVPHRTVSCLTAVGTGAGFSWTLRVGDQASPEFLPSFRSGSVLGTSYAAPIVSFFETGVEGLDASDYNTEGGEQVQIHGRNFGVQVGAVESIRYSAPASATFDVDVSACAITVPHEVITCSIAPGAGADMEWKLVISGQESSNPVTSYGVPVVTAIEGAAVDAASTDGGQPMTLRGENFGPIGGAEGGPFVTAVTYGLTGTEYTVTDFTVVSHTQIDLVTVPGVGKGLRVVVVVAGQTSPPSTPTLSYATPEITNISPVTASTHGQVAVTVTGTNFGLLDSTAYVTIMFGNTADETLVGPLDVVSRSPKWEDIGTAAQAAPGTPHTVTFTLPRGLGLDRGVVLLVNSRQTGASVASLPTFFDYAGPELDFVEVSTVAPLGATPTEEAQAEIDFITEHLSGVALAEVRRLRLNGRNFGPCAACRADGGTDAVSRVVLMQQLDEGLVPVGDFTTDLGYVFNWDHEVVTMFTAVRYGAVVVNITSTSFYDAESQLPQSTSPVSFVDFSPRVSGLSGAITTFATAGGEILEIDVLHLLSTTELEMRVNNRTCPLVDASGALIPPAEVYDRIIKKPDGTIITPDTTWTVRCLTPPGQGRNQFVVVYRDGQRSSGFPVDYRRPVVTGVSVVASGSPHTQPKLVDSGVVTVAADTQGYEMQIDGNNLGDCPVVYFGKSMDIAETGVVGAFTSVRFCDPITPGASSVATHTKLTLPVPEGYGVDVEVLVVAGDQKPVERVFLDYNPPQITSLAVAPADSIDGIAAGPTSGLTSGGAPVVVTLSGNNFGIDGDSFGLNVLKVWLGRDGPGMMGYALCEGVARDAVDPHHKLTFELPPGSGSLIAAKLAVPGHRVTSAPLFRYRAPSLTATLGVARPAAADPGFTPEESARRLEGAPEGGAGAASELARRLVATPASPSAQRDGPTNGGTLVTLTGTNMGGKNESHCVFVMWANTQHTPAELSCNDVEDFPGEGQVPFANIVSATHEEVVFRMPPGMGARMIYLQLRGVVSNNGVPYRYDNPELLHMTPRNGTTEGGTELTLYGLSLGTPAFAGVSQVMVNFHRSFCVLGGADCAIVSHSHNQIVFTSPAGVGVGRNVSIVVQDRNSTSDRVATAPITFTYNPPEITFVVPNLADSRGAPIAVRGLNFGRREDAETEEEKAVSVIVDAVPCNDVQRVERFGEAALECNMQTMVVGAKNITITIAGQNGFIDARAGVFFTYCIPGFYGQDGEYCLDCPVGATCDGGVHEPRSDAGWYNLNRTIQESGRCDPLRSHREFCNYVVPCEPKEACTGNNTCAVGYVSKEPTLRCADCDQGYYRRAGECIECPDNPLLLVVGFLAGALGLCIAGYIMNRKSVNLAFVSIGVDYFQVLAMFANSRVQWPAVIKEMFHAFSVFNLNLEITAPECSIPDLGYELKWFFAESLPLAAGGMFLVAYVVLYLNKRCILRRTKRLHRHSSILIAMAFVSMYYLYLYLTRTILDVFNCSPTDPPDGNTYLEVVFEECGVAGGLQMRLLPFAVIALLVYTLGYPSTVGWVLYKNREKIMEDQLLRAQGTGTDRLTNPRGYSVRKRYSKLYYHFQPDYWYWILVVIARKFFIAFTSLMFNKNPAFQLSIALLVMFACYAAQVRCRPYMSMSQHAYVMELHKRSVEAGDKTHLALEANMADTRAHGKARVHRRVSWTGDLRARYNDSNGAKAVEYCFDYNTVEQTLLACAVLVNLAGVMFESNRLQSDHFSTQRDAVTIGVLCVIVFSIIYFGVVFVSEVVTTCCPNGCCRRGAGKSGRARPNKRAGNKPSLETMALGPGRSVSSRGSIVIQGANPMFQKQQNDAETVAGIMSQQIPPNADGWAVVQHRVGTLEEELRAMAEANRELKQRLARGATASPARRTPGSGRSRKRGARHEFEATRSRNDAPEGEVEVEVAAAGSEGATRSSSRRNRRAGRRAGRGDRPKKNYSELE